MTNEEAREILSKINIAVGFDATPILSKSQILEATSMAIKALEQQPNRCDSCVHSEEQDGSNCYECVKGITDNFELMRDATEEERKSVKDYVESISKPTGVHFDETQPTDADCISREELLKKCVYAPIAPVIKGDGVHYEDVVFAKDIINAKPLYPKAKWIPVSERLPEEYGEYMITWTTSMVNGEYCLLGIAEYESSVEYDHENNRFNGEWILDDYINNYPNVKVTAWMPLPEPYKAESEDNV